MNIIRKILIPVDFSDHALRALQYGMQLAEALGAQVDVLHVAMPVHVYEPLDRAIFGDAASSTELEQRMRAAAQTHLDEFVERLSEGERSRLGKRIEWGVPHQVITQLAERDGYDLVVVGTHGRTGLPHALVGSVTERVLRHAPCPVLAVR